MTFARASLRISAGIIVWALHFAAIYGFTGFACARRWTGAVPWAVYLATLVAGIACIFILAREVKRREQFTSWLGAGLAAIALLAILWESAPILVVKPCV